MPTYDFRCRNSECPGPDVKFESLLRHWDDPNPSCPYCRVELERQVAAPHLGWINKPYTDLDLKEDHVTSGNYCKEGVWVPRLATKVGDKPGRRLARTPEEHRRLCKEEGWIYPADLPPHVEIAKDGKTLKGNGNAGQWV